MGLPRARSAPSDGVDWRSGEYAPEYRSNLMSHDRCCSKIAALTRCPHVASTKGNIHHF